jgi:6-pyruvoyltetrahydropterin/6-carboxytetrahydropterin synthase
MTDGPRSSQLPRHCLTLETVFSAAHAIVMRGKREPVHGHDWRVTVRIGGDTLDTDGLLVDFHKVHHDLQAIIEPWHNRSLNEAEPFDTVNPTAELVAQTIGERLATTLPDGVRVVSVRVTEAVGCAAEYWAGG